MQEQFFLQENGVTISQVRFVTPNQTFAMQGITSVAHNVFLPSKKWARLAMALGAFLGLIGVILLAAGTGTVIGLLGLLAGVVTFGQGIVRLRDLKPYHQVILNASTTASASTTGGGGLIGGSLAVGAATTRGSSQNFVVALSSKDEEFIRRVIGALNEALIARG